MNPLLKEIRRTPLLWLLVAVPVLFAAQKLKPDAHTPLFVLSILAIVPSFSERYLSTALFEGI